MFRRLSKQFVCEKLILFKEVLWKLICQEIKAFLVLKNQFKFGTHSPKSSPGFRLYRKNGNKLAKEVDDKCGFSEHVRES